MKIVEFIFGILVLFFGILPWISKFGGIADKMKEFATPGSPQYQIMISALGALLIIVSLAGRKSSVK